MSNALIDGSCFLSLKSRNRRAGILCLIVGAGLTCATQAWAGDAASSGGAQAQLTAAAAAPTTEQASKDADDMGAGATGRYGPLGVFDHASVYGRDFFPEPLNADEADVDNEIAGHWFHGEGSARRYDEGGAEAEKSFGMLTVEVAGGYESDRVRSVDSSGFETIDSSEGFTNIELGARHPFYQYVTVDGFFDTTFVAGIEISPPVHSHVSRDLEIVPKVFNLTRIGKHFSVQAGFGDSILVGPESHGLSTLEYDVLLGYEIDHETMPIPGVQNVTPIIELDGERTLNQDDAGHNELFVDLGARVVFESLDILGGIEPKLGAGVVLPVDDGARAEFSWGIVSSVIFEY